MTEQKDGVLCLGYIRLDRPSDLRGDECECEGCDQTCERGIWLAVMSDGTLYGPLCEVRATSD